ncbi:MAG TPA: tetratricopeptide repeat protein [bacterium]|nr:tetratricopeptide repeat protein [bacterium]
MKIRIMILAVICILILKHQNFAFVRADGYKVETSQTLKNGDVLIKGGLLINQKIKPHQDLELKSLSIPLSINLGLTKNREAGFFLQLDDQKADTISNQYGTRTLSKIGLTAKAKIFKDLSAKMTLGYSINGKSYYSADGIFVIPELMYDFPLQVGVLFSNIGYEYVDGKYNFLGEENKINMSKRFIYGIGYFYPATQNLGFNLEYTGSQKYAENFKNLGAINFTSKYRMDPDIILVTALSFGMSDGSPKNSVYIGFEKYFGLFEKQNDYLNYRWKSYDKTEVAASTIKTKKISQKRGEGTKVKYCNTCGYTTTGEERFCPEDGTRLIEELQIEENKCGVCGNEIPEDANFCPFCGAKARKVINLDKDAVKKPEVGTTPINELEDEPIASKSSEIADLSKVEILLDDAKKFFDKENYDKAIDVYLAAAKIDPTNHKIWYNLGVTYYFNKQYADAKNAFERAIKIKSKDVDTLLYLGAVQGLLRQKNDAVRTFKRVLEIEPNNDIARRNLQKMGYY